MSYCTQSDIEKLIPTLELAELTTESGSTPDAATVTEAIAKADAEIDSYLGAVFTLPLSTTPARVKSLVGRYCHLLSVYEAVHDPRGPAEVV